MNDIKLERIIYKKFFNFREQAERFIEKHKKQDCFYLEYCEGRHCWIVEKTEPVDIETVLKAVGH